MPITNHPRSVNTFALSKIWYRSAAIYIKCGDITKIDSRIKSWVYQDNFEKPEQEILCRKIEDGGLGLTNLRQKMKANLLCNFMQTAKNDNFKESLYHKTLYDFYVQNTGVKTPSKPPYYSQSFFNDY